MEIFTIMANIAMEDNRLINWKGRAEQSVIEGKLYKIKYSPKSPLGGYLYNTPTIMRFKYLEDYDKMKKLEKMIGKLLDKLDYESIQKNDRE